MTGNRCRPTPRRLYGAICGVVVATVSIWVFFGGHEELRVIAAKGVGSSCVDIAKSIPEPYSHGYRLRNQKLDIGDNAARYSDYRWEGSIDRGVFDNFGRPGGATAYFKTVNSTLYVRSSSLNADRVTYRYARLVEMVLIALAMYDVDDMDFAVEFEDRLACGQPALTYSLDLTCGDRAGFAMPSYSAYESSLGLTQMDALFECLDRRYPYDSGRIPKAVWRGSTTGSVLDSENYMENRRVKMAMLARERPDIMDVGLSSYVQLKEDDPKIKGLLKKTVPRLPFIKMEDFNKNALIVDLDGNGWSDRFFQLVRYNTPIFKQELTQNQEYFGHLIKGGVHVEFFKSDLSDFVPSMEKLLGEFKENEERLKEMMRNLQIFGKENLSHLAVIRAMAYILKVYKSKLEWATEWEEGYEKVDKPKETMNQAFPKEMFEDLFGTEQHAIQQDKLTHRKLQQEKVHLTDVEQGNVFDQVQRYSSY